MSMNREELLRSARNLYENPGTNEALKVVLEETYPELKESEDERIRKTLIHIVKGACDKYGIKYKGDDITEEKLLAYLERQKDLAVIPDELVKNYKLFCEQGGRELALLINAINGFNKLKEQQPAEWSEDIIRKAIKEVGLTQHQIDWFKTNVFPPKQEWSEEDEDMRDTIIRDLKRLGGDIVNVKPAYKAEIDWLKSLRPQPKQESEPIEIKYAGKIYKVYGTKELPGGVVGYIIEDEPGHYDCIIHPDEVLGGEYGIKSNGSPYPTKEANFGQPSWKPSEIQMKAMEEVRTIFHHHHLWDEINPILYDYEELMRDLYKLL